MLLTYDGKSFRVQDIIGQLRKDDASKDILVRVDAKTGRAVDELGRAVNANGYLIDERGSILDKDGVVMFNFWELLH